LGLQDTAQCVDVRQQRAKEAGLAVRDHQQRREVIHFYRIDQVGLILDVDPDKMRSPKFSLQLVKQRAVIPARSAPLGAEAGDQQA